MNKTLLALYGLKWNPFSPELPTEALQTSARVDSFCWRTYPTGMKPASPIVVASGRIRAAPAVSTPGSARMFRSNSS